MMLPLRWVISSMRSKKFSGCLENLEKIGDFIIQAAQQAGLDDSAAYQVQLAVDEAATNIIEHAYGGDGQGDIRCCYEISPEALTIVLIDQGVPFDPELVPEPITNAPLECVKSRGLGLFLMRKVMDEVRFEFSPQKGNMLTMVKRKKR